MVGRSTTRFMDSPLLPRSPLQRKKKGPLISRVQQIKEIKKQTPPIIGKLIEGLLDAYTKLLQATSSDEPRSRKGARSLMSTCLRHMPGYIELEEHFAQLDKEEAADDVERDIPDEIYTHLESTFSAESGRGWRSFRELVRAHATSLMCDAFSAGMFGLEVLDAAVDLCIKTSAWEEAEKLVGAYFDNVKPLPMPLNLHANLFDQKVSVYMHLVRVLVEHTGRHGFMYDVLAHLIANDLLNLEWLATYCMKPVWNRLVRTLCDEDDRIYEQALRFLQATIWAGIGLPDYSSFEDENDMIVRQLKPSARHELRGALDTTFSSLFTLLAGRALAFPAQAERLTSVLNSLTINLLGRSDVREDLELVDTTSDNMQNFAQRALWMITASSLVHLERCGLSPGAIELNAAELIKSSHWVAYQYSCHEIDVSQLFIGLPAFISSIARYSGKLQQCDGFEHLESLITKLLSLKDIRLPHKLWSLNRLALETSMEFAQLTNEGNHYAFARQVERSMSSGGRVLLVRSPEKGETPSRPRGFRLEEGIGEWVACTPFAKGRLHGVQSELVFSFAQLPSPEPSDHTDRSSEDTPNCSAMAVMAATGATIPVIGKRPCASSPKVIIPYKRVRLSELAMVPSVSRRSLFSPSEADEASNSGPRRSRRARKLFRDNPLHPEYSLPLPSVHGRSLRGLPRRNYTEPNPPWVEDADDEESSGEEGPSPEHEPTAFTNKTNLPGRHPGNENPLRRGRGRPKKQYSVPFEEKENVGQDDEDDELGKTPSRPGKQSQIPVVKVANSRTDGGERRSKRFKSAFVPSLPDDDSEDELSFA